MSKAVLLALLLATCLATSALAQRGPNTRYENINIDAIIKNERILLVHYKCVMDQGPCNKDGKNFKRALPEALRTNCEKCTPFQKMMIRTLLLAIKNKSEPKFMELLDKYDPPKSYRESLLNFLYSGH